ncbi:hypothetical protein SB778_03565 [Paraburkholderia sp. SIMBA_050]
MELPIRAFWTLNRNINRLLAETDLRALMLHVSRQSSEGCAAYEAKLRAEVYAAKETDPLNAERDEAGFAELKAMVARPAQ